MSMFLWTQNQSMQGSLSEYKAALAKARAERDQLKEKLEHSEFHKEQWMTHYSAEHAVRIRAMQELDEVYGGEENNPLRAQAYGDANAFRIPSGDRKGEVVSKADHIYLSKIRDLFSKHYSSKFSFCKSWVDFINSSLPI